jgi:beta-galactosidase GanA
MNFYIPKKIFLLTICGFLFLSLAPVFAQTGGRINKNSIPHLAQQGSATQLIVNGKPFLMLGGETGNSSVSNSKNLDSMWPKIVKMNLNTLVCPVYWELMEPKEGEFNFELVDSMIIGAGKNNIKLVLLWFGSWKNSMSCYAPLWVKTDGQRFGRARQKDGKAKEILSAFDKNNLIADANAFKALMKHIREVDEKNQTVVLVQVENEIGMIPDARDYCKSANEAFNSPAPVELINCLVKNKEHLNPYLYYIWKSNGFKTTGTWEEVFGKGTQADELFTAWNYAVYANFIAAAGKKEYPLPMYVNAALNRPGYKPGQYPSGGPLPHLMDIWKAAAPEIDFLAPDIYFKNFSEWVSKYDIPANKPGEMYNQFFIPEADNSQSVVNAFYAIARHNIMGYSPFAIESLQEPFSSQLANGYDVLKQLSPLILSNQGKGVMTGVSLDSANQSAEIKLGGYVFMVKHEYSWPYAPKTQGDNPRYGGMIIMASPDEFYVAGRGMVITFKSAIDDGSIAGIGSIDEGRFEDGKWIPGLRLNGDQSHQGRHMNLPGNIFSIQKVKLYKYK